MSVLDEFESPALPVGEVVCTLPGKLVLAPMLPRVEFLDETRRTQPFDMAELATRWRCSEETVDNRVPAKWWVKMGYKKTLRPCRVFQLEEQSEGVTR